MRIASKIILLLDLFLIYQAWTTTDMYYLRVLAVMGMISMTLSLIDKMLGEK